MKNVVITGASSGIGHAAAVELAQHGYRVFGSVRNAEDAARVQGEIGTSFRPLVFDVTDSQAVRRGQEVVARDVDGHVAGVAGISGVYAKVLFELTAENSDTTGIDGDTTYTLTSKTAVDTDAIKDNLKVEPDVSYSIDKVSDTEYRIKLDEKLEPNTNVRMALATIYTDEEEQYNAPYQMFPRSFFYGLPYFSFGFEYHIGNNNYHDYGKNFIKKVATYINSYLCTNEGTYQG